MVVGDQALVSGCPVFAVVPDGGGHSQQACANAGGGDAVDAAAVVQLPAELAFEGTSLTHSMKCRIGLSRFIRPRVAAAEHPVRFDRSGLQGESDTASAVLPRS